jgi:glycosyltransferase involved in cell wall biosynthesis
VTPIREPQLGGSQTIVADLSAGLAARSHDVDVYAASGSTIDGVNVIDTGVDAAELASSLFRAGDDTPRSTDAARRAFASVYAAIAERDYDVVHNHAFDAPAIVFAPDATVHTLHLGPDLEIAAAIRDTSGVVVCVSEWQRRAWSHSVTVDAVVRNGVPVDRIPWSADAGEGALYAGRLSPEKGVAEAVEIAIAAGVPITVVGNAYDTEYAAELMQTFGGRDGVVFMDALPRAALWELMSRSCAVLCPVRWDEPFGLVGAEAQAAGTPVIGFDRGALDEVVLNETTGALVEDVEDAAAALRDVARFGRIACREHAEKHLSLESTLDAYEEVYDR